MGAESERGRGGRVHLWGETWHSADTASWEVALTTVCSKKPGCCALRWRF